MQVAEHLQTKVNTVKCYNCNVGGISRAGDPSLYQQDDPNKLMYKETGAGVGAETFGRNLAKEREYERIKNQLKQEFSKIDFDNNG